MKRNKNVKKAVTGLMISALVIGGASAFLMTSKTGTATNSITVGKMDIKFNNQMNVITINETHPMSRAFAEANLTPYEFTVDNNSPFAMRYSLSAKAEAGNTIPNELINIILNDGKVVKLSEANLLLNQVINKGASDKHKLIAYIDENALNDVTTKSASFHLELTAEQYEIPDKVVIDQSYNSIEKSQIGTTVTTQDGVSKNVETHNITGASKQELLDKLDQSGLANKAEVDAIVEVKGQEYDGLNTKAEFDVSSIAQEGDKVVILHFNEKTGEWEYIGEDTVTGGKVSGNFTSYSPIAFVVVDKNGNLVLNTGSTSQNPSGPQLQQINVHVEFIDADSYRPIEKLSPMEVTVPDGSNLYDYITIPEGYKLQDTNPYIITPEVTCAYVAVLDLSTVCPSMLAKNFNGSGVDNRMIKQINFTNTAPLEHAKTWDASAAKDGSVTGYLVGSDRIDIVPTQKTILPVNSSGLFSGFKYANITGLETLDTSQVTDMSYMFMGYGSDSTAPFSLDINNWDVSNVTDMTYMFSKVTGVNANISNWNTAKLTNMNGMFNEVFKSNIEGISNLNTSSVTNMSHVFSRYNANHSELNLDLSKWDTSKVESMSGMFGNANQYAGTFTITGLDKWDVSNVTSMYGMFANAGSHSTTWNVGDLSNWNVSKVTDMYEMFSCAGQEAANWNVGDLSNWNTSNVTNMYRMFADAGSYSTTVNGGISIMNSNTNVGNMFYGFGKFNDSVATGTFKVNYTADAKAKAQEAVETAENKTLVSLGVQK